MPRPVIAALYVAFVLLFALVLRWRHGAPWRQFFIGAAVAFVYVTVVSLILTFIVGFGSALFTPNAPAFLRSDEPLLILLPVLFGPTGEEVLRCYFLWHNRQMPVWHAAMFGVGFGGYEVLNKAGGTLLAAPHYSATLWATLSVAMGFVFHIALTAIVNRAYAQGARFAAVLTVAACYHTGLDFALVLLAINFAPAGDLAATIFWAAMTPVHLAVAWRLYRQGDRAPVPSLLC